MKALVGAFNQEKALVGAFSVIVRPVVEPMDRFTALIRILCTVFHAMVRIWSANYFTGRGRDWLTITNPVSTRMKGGGGSRCGWISWLGRGRFRWSRSRTIQDTMRREKKGNNPATQEHGWLITDKLGDLYFIPNAQNQIYLAMNKIIKGRYFICTQQP